MPQSLHLLHTHIIFSTKNRHPLLLAEHRPHLHAYMAGILYKLDCRSIVVGGIEDHIHIGCAITKKHPTMKVLELLKKDSSKWLKSYSPIFHNFYWQDGYALFSISSSHIEPLKKYIMNQVEHHRKETFKEEFIRLLKKNKVEYDERYLWN